MSSVRNIALSGIIAAIIATGLIVAVVLVPGTGLGVQINSSTTPAVRSSSLSSTSTESAQSIGSSSTGQGYMAVLLTDPPTVPANVTAVYMQYDEVQAHIADAGNQTGWYDLSGSGDTNLMVLVNASQTVANQTLPSGKFNGLRFNVTGVTITYENQNYSAQTIYDQNTLYVWIPGGINVTVAQTTAALIDLSPTVLMTGGPDNASFVFVPAAVGYVIPTASIPAESHLVGNTAVLTTNPWWVATVEQGTKFGISNVILTATSLNISVVNQGTSSIILRLAAVTTQTSTAGGIEGELRSSDVFVIESNGSLANLNTTNTLSVDNQVVAAGLLLAPGQSVTFHYSGSIVIGVQISLGLHMPWPGSQSITAGTTYHVWVSGNNQIAQAGVRATS
jgi:hypothetical protein